MRLCLCGPKPQGCVSSMFIACVRVERLRFRIKPGLTFRADVVDKKGRTLSKVQGKGRVSSQKQKPHPTKGVYIFDKWSTERGGYRQIVDREGALSTKMSTKMGVCRQNRQQRGSTKSSTKGVDEIVAKRGTLSRVSTATAFRPSASRYRISMFRSLRAREGVRALLSIQGSGVEH